MQKNRGSTNRTLLSIYLEAQKKKKAASEEKKAKEKKPKTREELIRETEEFIRKEKARLYPQETEEVGI